MSLGADFSSALEVNDNSPANPTDAASASDEGKPTGDVADDRKAMNRASEALKVSRGLEGQMNQLTNLVTQALVNNQGGNAATTEPAKEPFDVNRLKESLASGDSQAFVDDLKQVISDASQEARVGAVGDAERAVQARDLRTRLVKNLGLADPNREENQKIFALADQLQRDYPSNFGNDSAGAQLAASAEYWRGVALGSIDAPDDIRAERLDKGNMPGGGDSAAPAEPSETTITPDWAAKDRGLPAPMAAQLKSWGMKDLLTPSSDPHAERVARETIAGFLDDGNHGG